LATLEERGGAGTDKRSEMGKLEMLDFHFCTADLSEPVASFPLRLFLTIPLEQRERNWIGIPALTNMMFDLGTSLRFIYLTIPQFLQCSMIF
jgi:hypothetical protein